MSIYKDKKSENLTRKAARDVCVFYLILFCWEIEKKLFYERKENMASLSNFIVIRCNSQNEMAWAFKKAGFSAIDVSMKDLLLGYINLSNFNGIVAVGGFSYGDVLGAGDGWAKTIIFNNKHN